MQLGQIVLTIDCVLSTQRSNMCSAKMFVIVELRSLQCGHAAKE